MIFTLNIGVNTLLFNKKPRLSKFQTVGVLTNFLTEQVIQRDFITKKMDFGECEDLIEKNKIEVVFIEKQLYEEDHPWLGFNLDERIQYFKKLNVNIIIINNSDDTKIIDKECFQINVSVDNSDNFSYTNDALMTPILINERKYNPIDSKKIKDVLIIDLNSKETELSDEFKKFIKIVKPTIDFLKSDNISRSFIKNLLLKIKKYKVLYFLNSNIVNKRFLLNLELLCAAQKTIMIIDSEFEFDLKFNAHSYDEETNINYLQSFLNPGVHNDHKMISDNRLTFLRNSLMQYKGLPNLINGDTVKEEITISVITSTKRKWTLKDYIKRLNQQNDIKLESILLTHGFELTEVEKKELYNLANFSLSIISAKSNIVFGACLNMCIDEISFKYFTKIDDDDFYYPNYLIDSWIALEYSKADIVGKYSQFVYLEELDLTIQRFSSRQYIFSEYVAGATIFSESEFIKKYRFSEIPKAVDSDILRRVKEDNGTIYCNHPYEFCIFRDDDKESHTWQAPDTHLLRSADILFYGDPSASLSIN